MCRASILVFVFITVVHNILSSGHIINLNITNSSVGLTWKHNVVSIETQFTNFGVTVTGRERLIRSVRRWFVVILALLRCYNNIGTHARKYIYYTFLNYHRIWAALSNKWFFSIVSPQMERQNKITTNLRMCVLICCILVDQKQCAAAMLTAAKHIRNLERHSRGRRLQTHIKTLKNDDLWI